MVRARLKILIALVCLPFLAILARLGTLQFDTEWREELVQKAEHSTSFFTSPRRGRILARDGKTVLAGNQSVCQLHFQYNLLNPRDAPLRLLASVLLGPAGSPSREVPSLYELDQRILELSQAEIRAPRDEAEREEEGDSPGTATPEAWLLLLENVDAGKAQRLTRAWKNSGAIFQVREAARGGTFEVWFLPEKAVQMEITLARLADLLERNIALKLPAPGSTVLTELAGRIEKVLERTEERIQREVQKDRKQGVEPLALRRKARDLADTYHAERASFALEIPPAAVTEIEYRPWLYPGILIVDAEKRIYPLKEACGTLTGHTRPLDRVSDDKDTRKSWKILLSPGRYETDAELEEARREGRKLSDLVGLGGLEQKYDSRLRGTYGISVARINRMGRLTDVREETPAEAGADIRTTIDAELQRIVYCALERAVPRPVRASDGTVAIPGDGTAASAAVMEIETGGLLASAGFPGVDPGRLTDGVYPMELEKTWGKTTTAWLLDRPSYFYLFPGSVFKIVVAAAAMEGAQPWEGEYSPERRYPCHHKFDLLTAFECDAVNGHTATGDVDLVEALQFSCNNYFYYLGLNHLAPEAIEDWATKLGYGVNPELDLPSRLSQAGKLRPILDEQREAKRCMLSIGQTMVEATPLQVLRSYAAIATGGRSVPRPYLVQASKPDPLVFKNPRTIELIREGLWRVAHAPGGTAAKEEHHLARFNAAYKTGTAEMQRGDTKINHAWVAGFAPFDRPRIAFVAVVEQTRLHGAEAAGPIVEKILDYFAKEEPDAYLVQRGAGLKGKAR